MVEHLSIVPVHSEVLSVNTGSKAYERSFLSNAIDCEFFQGSDWLWCKNV